MRSDVGHEFLDLQLSVRMDMIFGVSEGWSKCILHVGKDICDQKVRRWAFSVNIHSLPFLSISMGYVYLTLTLGFVTLLVLANEILMDVTRAGA